MLAYKCYKATGDEEASRRLDSQSCTKILEEYRFLLQTIVNSGIGEETYAPKNVMEGREDSASLTNALSEMDDIIFTTLDRLFSKTGISPSEINILVVNVSLFSTFPSLASRVMNHYKIRDNVKTFNLSGMGCSASLEAIDLVQQLFNTYNNKLAIVISTECMGPHWYYGKEKSMILSNCSNDEAYNCCIQEEDADGYQGFRLTKKLTKSTVIAFTKNLQVLVPKILPLKELLRYILVSYYRNYTKTSTKTLMINLKTGVEHFCIHSGGRAVIDELGKSLG
ncbi:hypothetical protein EZV62_025532 [Acer yangbiense]|uniref:FAE domain-containing protein n=1 Tax=Acer yangbiense TaxID=1000413 RepID=A0A5C7GYR3_9ROSI|nr:hypothetical protein EZV62_025532 [Acer yangbiense]